MFFSKSLIKNSYDELIELDYSDGKSRKERVSGLRYLLATSKLLHEEKTNRINLAVGSNSRPSFIIAVGNVVAFNDQGSYSKDFAGELDEKKDYGVGSNFYTTRLAASRSQDIRYPGRPAPLLLLEQEHASILANVEQTLSDSYGIDEIKAALCVWLLRNEDFAIDENTSTAADLQPLIEAKLRGEYTPEIVDAIICDQTELQNLLSRSSDAVFVSDKPYHLSIFVAGAIAEESALISARVLTDDLPDDDQVFTIVQQLLERGAKGILFTGPPGTSKTWYALKVALKIISADENRLERVQFHPSFTYEDFIEGLVSTGSASGTEPMFKPKDKVFLNLCERARNNTDHLYILIIDEFSRGDPSKIFGELLTYIEPDYRDIVFRLPYSEKEISIPQNIVIFATMNPYDKSVVDLDAAMERRFDVIALIPDINILTSLLKSSGIASETIGKTVEFFKIANNLSLHGFGHTYFKDVREEVDYILLWNHKLKFTFEKMFRFKEDTYKEVRAAYLEIISDDKKDVIA